MRIADGKENSVILDNVGLYNRFGTPMANRHWRSHFLGSDEDGEGFNDGTSYTRDILVESERAIERDYSEDDEEMLIVEHAVGNKQIRPDDANAAASLSDYNVFRKKGLYGICDRHNRTIVPPVYEDMHPYYNGYIPFKQNGYWGIMLRNGTVKVKPKYYHIGPFVNGYAEVQNTVDSPKYYINGKLEKVNVPE